VVFSLEKISKKANWRKAKDDLFGRGGRGVEERGILHIGDAQLPAELRAEVKKQNWSKEDVLYSLTGIRRQTAINEDGAPDHATLRSMRVLLPGVTLEAPVSFDGNLSEMHLQLLAVAILDFRRAGTGRNRGRGWIKAELEDEQTTQDLFKSFGEAIS
jgi:hypothetical protein